MDFEQKSEFVYKPPKNQTWKGHFELYDNILENSGEIVQNIKKHPS